MLDIDRQKNISCPWIDDINIFKGNIHKKYNNIYLENYLSKIIGSIWFHLRKF